jgi:phosphotransferase system  glucose/maltose/N-acetylglucosamine-specific IIC component
LASDQASPDESKITKSVETRDDLIFELIKRRYDGVLTDINSLDTKSASLIGFVSVVAGLIIGGGTFDISAIAKSYAFYIPYFLAIGFLIASILFGLKAFRQRNHPVVPNVEVLLKNYTKPNVLYSHVLQASGSEMVKAIRLIEKSNRQKADDINRSWVLLIIGLVIVFVFLMIFTFLDGSLKESVDGNKTGKNTTSMHRTQNMNVSLR